MDFLHPEGVGTYYWESLLGEQFLREVKNLR